MVFGGVRWCLVVFGGKKTHPVNVKSPRALMMFTEPGDSFGSLAQQNQKYGYPIYMI